ncbi:MAG: hypothetical protein DCC49_02130 [Acidobacteria bacterium]|nr:MAG: hypothetical protein DCC49_02130 [Acidobacteriota bacterium]
MPTYEATEDFLRAYRRLDPSAREAFRRALARFIEDAKAREFRPGLRVKGVRGLPGCFEMTWASDGRAIFKYGPAVRAGEPHFVWVAIGGHSILP